jgi:hypothetical protein
MKNPLAHSIQSATKANDDLGALFGKMGTSEHPSGSILVAYRNARRAMTSALSEQDKIRAANEVMRGLRATVSQEVTTSFKHSQELGQELAFRQLGFYGKSDQPQAASMTLFSQADTAKSAVLAKVDAQTAGIHAILTAGLDDTLVVGNSDFEGLLKNIVTLDIAFWIASLAWDSWQSTVQIATKSQDDLFQKQAIATLDQRTTECCLLVHGQIQPLDQEFHLEGPPAYADYLDWPPFHGWCRTSVALYKPEYDEGITDQLTTDAAQVLAERNAGVNKVRRPADAYA